MTSFFDGVEGNKPIQDETPTDSFFSGIQGAEPLSNDQQKLATRPQISSTSDSKEVPSSDPVGSNALAAIGGLSTGAANIGETIFDAGTWVANKVGLISPKTKKLLDASMADTVAPLKSDYYKDDIVAQAKKEHPIVSKASEIAVEAPALLKASISGLGAAKGAGMLEKGLAAGSNLLANTGLNAALAAGMAGPNTENQDQAAKLAAAITPIATGIGAGIQQLTKKPLIPTNLINYTHEGTKPVNEALAKSSKTITDQAAESISNLATKVKEVADSNWTNIKQLPGTINTNNINQQLKFMLEKTGSKVTANGWDHAGSLLEKPQINALMELADNASSLKNMDDALALKHIAGKGFSNFTGKTDLVYKLYKNIQNNIDDSIVAKAKEAGIGSDWTLANKFHKDVVIPLQNANAFDIAKATANKVNDPNEYNLMTKTLFTNATKSPEAMKALLNTMDDKGSQIIQQKFIQDTFNNLIDSPDAFNPNNALLKINQFKAKFGSTLSRDSNEVLVGLKQVLKEGGAQAGAAGETLGKRLLQQGAGSSLGGTLGFMIGGPIGGGIGAAAGYINSQALYKSLNHLLNTKSGIHLLKYIGQKKPGSGIVLKTLSTALPAELAKMNGETNDEQK